LSKAPASLKPPNFMRREEEVRIKAAELGIRAPAQRRR
jgi:hypothetical protein